MHRFYTGAHICLLLQNTNTWDFTKDSLILQLPRNTKLKKRETRISQEQQTSSDSAWRSFIRYENKQLYYNNFYMQLLSTLM